MIRAKRRIAIKALAALALTASCSLALAAQVVGVIANLSGPLMVKKADGSVKVLALRSEVEQGDTLVSEKNTYAQIRFIDNSEITLKPGTSFTIEAFAYEAARPEGDNASFNLLKGGLRSVSGLLGKRNREKFSLKTPTATIGIRGTTFVAEYVGAGGPAATPAPGPAGAGASSPPALLPGLHVFVVDGLIALTNSGGTQAFGAGQFGFVRNTVTAPVLVPNNPALKFSPPAVFSTSSVGTPGATGAKPNTVDCEVR